MTQPVSEHSTVLCLALKDIHGVVLQPRKGGATKSPINNVASSAKIGYRWRVGLRSKMSESQVDKLSSSPTKISLTAGDYGDGGGSVEAEDQLSFVPPLAIISSRVKRSLSLSRLANPGVAVVHYDYQTTSLARLLQLVGDTLKARKALSIAMVVNGQPGSFQLTQQQVCKILTYIKHELEAQLKRERGREREKERGREGERERERQTESTSINIFSEHK